MNPITKICRQHEKTWSSLQRHIAGIPFQYSNLFDQHVQQFVHNKAIALGSCIGYFAPALLTTTAFILAKNDVTVHTTTHLQLPNIYTMIIGYPWDWKIGSHRPRGNNSLIDHFLPRQKHHVWQSNFISTRRQTTFKRMRMSFLMSFRQKYMTFFINCWSQTTKQQVGTYNYYANCSPEKGSLQHGTNPGD